MSETQMERDDGYAAYLRGESLDSNPHSGNPARFLSWRTGWKDAAKDSGEPVTATVSAFSVAEKDSGVTLYSEETEGHLDGLQAQFAHNLKPCFFTFDDGRVWRGFAHGSTWNGFDNVAVTPETRDKVRGHFPSRGDELTITADQGLDGWDQETLDDFAALPIGSDGLVSFGWGYATTIIDPHAVAAAFRRVLAKWLAPDELREIDRRNAEAKARGDNDTCATHDFCDSNMAMVHALEEFGLGDGFDPSNEAECALINESWELAKKKGFAEPSLFQVEFPDFDPSTMPAIPADWQDASWHNDACPFFIASSTRGVFVDYADPSRRDMPESKRFSVCRLENSQHVTLPYPLLVTDEWSDVIRFLAFRIGQRVRLSADHDCYPVGIFRKGECGEIVALDDFGTFRVKMDHYFPELDEWENCLEWYLENGDNPTENLEPIPDELTAAIRTVTDYAVASGENVESVFRRMILPSDSDEELAELAEGSELHLAQMRELRALWQAVETVNAFLRK